MGVQLIFSIFEAMSVNKHIFIWLTLLGLLVPNKLLAQFINTPITLYQQFNGKYDYTVIGNTHNTADNSTNSTCQFLTSSSATLNLNPNQTIEAAYLIWSGISDGMATSVSLNGNLITPDYTNLIASGTPPFSLFWFSAVKDITSYAQNFGNGIYQITNFDLNPFTSSYCFQTLDYSGWNIILVYSDNSLPNVQINIYDGLQIGSSVTFPVNNLNVTNTNNANMTCLSWNGSSNINFTQSIAINGNTLSNAQSPPNNPFNSTDSFTGSNISWNRDVDLFDISGFINIGDNSATIDVTSGLIRFISNIITSIPSELPDATINIETITGQDLCDNQTLSIDFTVLNVNSNDTLPQGTPVSIFANTNTFLGTVITPSEILIGDSLAMSTNVTIPANVTSPFDLSVIANQDATQLGVIQESNLTNNSADTTLSLTTVITPIFDSIPPVCQGTNLVFPTTSNNGISGTWSPTFNSQATTTYTFSPSSLFCADTVQLTVQIVPEIVPTFTLPDSICINDALVFPTASNNGIAGAWSPAFDNQNTTNYTFTPDSSGVSAGCPVSFQQLIEVVPQSIPSFSFTDSLCPNAVFTFPTSSDNGIIGTWSPVFDNQLTTNYTFSPNSSNLSNGCAASTSETITIIDIVNPTGTAPANLVLQCFANVPVADINAITDEADNCTAIPTVTFVSDVSNGNTCPEIITRTYNIADDNGNDIDVIQTIIINDDTAPTSSNISTIVQCLTDVPAVDISVVSDEADNCTANPTVAFVSESTDGSSCKGEIITRIYSVTDDCGNSINVTHTILVDSYTPNFTVSGQGTTTCDGSDGTITLSGLSPNTNYEMSYNGGTTNAITTNATGDYLITGLAAGSYTNYTVSDADCPACTSTENVSININDPTAAIINAGPDQQYCEGETIVLNAINPENANITWNNGITDGVGFIQPVGTTFYTITAERVNCFSSDQMSITVSPAITDITCPGDLTASCNISEQAPYADFNAFIAAGGSATIPVGGIIDSASFTLLSEVSDGITCPETITRTYQIADTCGVTLSCTQNIVISEIILPTGTAPNDTLVQCIGDVPIVDVNSITDETDNCSAIPIVTHISDVSDGNTCPEVITRTYNIEDKCGNNIDVVQTITINDDILPTASNPDTIFVDCLVDVPLADITEVTDEADNCTVNPTVAFVSESTDANTCNGEEITRIYSITDDCGNIIDVTQIIVIEVYNPVFTVSSTNPTTCLGNEGTITLSGLAPSAIYELNYNGGAIISITTNTAGEYTITGLVEGTYTGFTVTEGTCLTCSTTENVTMTLTDPLPPIVDAGADFEECEAETITLTASNPDTANISWDNGVVDGVGFIPPVGTTIYTVTAEKFNCFSTDDVQVTINPLPIVNAGNDFTVCDGDEATLSGSGADTYVWDNGVIDGVPFTPSLGTVTYTVIGTSIFGCTASDQVDVDVIISPDVSFVADRTIGCAPQEVNFISTSPGVSNKCIYTINGGEQISGCNVNHIFTEAGCYDINLQVELTNGCVDDLTKTKFICIDDYPVADFTVNPKELTSIYNIADFTNESTGATDYDWSFGDENFSNATDPSHEYSVDSIGQKYTFGVELIAYSNLGCPDTAKLDLPFFEELIYYIPNAFTPDGNQYNETFKPIFTTGFDPMEYNLKIFNRWGEVVFESNDAAIGWDGTYGTNSYKFAPSGAYVWRINFKKARNKDRVEIVGSVSLLR
ncbi:T9SS type B sorting domain-containing protein [Brumimicrobium glaciale]|uniref:T9SS type B sorting domain-containing protein n=1 Tax=Brumimicrobium glaciale TaxID=200475 RepID=A0A4Q4KJF6_9FLAO|nr:gliding motility-associated C-terminal domain-containing protein [Brumimicrobium glaciale]RYM32817.1 T9SS type B sorting domain-containing protein [Brumimicrobium glaciale]